jgi:iron complex transport system permease protein
MREGWRSPLLLIFLGVMAVAGTLVLGVGFGAEPISWNGLLSSFRGGGGEGGLVEDRFILMELRFPRVLLGLLVGGGLALAGAVFQALLRNPLAEPYILGISGGAAAAVVLVLALGWISFSSYLLPLAAFTGAGVAILLVFGVARAADRRLDVRILLLSGIVVGSFFTACIALFLSLSDAPTVRSAMLWMLGSLSGVSWRSVAIVAAYTLPLSLFIFALSRALNLMAIGEETAEHLGIRVERVKRMAFGAASFIAAAGVAFAGIIGFVGLIIPHAVRLLVGSDHRVLLPLSFLAGAVFLTLADIIARTVVAPIEIPIGVITSFVGVPFFLLLLVTRAR